jgi:hypothetical protein
LVWALSETKLKTFGQEQGFSSAISVGSAVNEFDFFECFIEVFLVFIDYQ